MRQAVFVSATPGPYEKQHAGQVVEQLVRPTGLVDPMVEVRPATHQVDDVLQEIRERVNATERVLITTLTKKMAEQLTDYLTDNGVKVRYLHSDVDTVERVEIIRDLRAGAFDVLVGINLLREGLDMPEVSLVAILDADKEGFLRSARSLIQTIGRAARNVHGRVIMYADRITAAMQQAIGETDRRRARQGAYNIEHGITPETVRKAVLDLSPTSGMTDYYAVPKGKAKAERPAAQLDEVSLAERIEAMRQEMFAAAEQLDFERAARIRDELKALQGTGPTASRSEASSSAERRAGRAPQRGAATRRKRPSSSRK